MKRFLLLLSAAFALGACSATPNNRINYVPPSTAPIRQSVDEARTHADRTSTALNAAAARAKTATDRIKVIEKAVADNPPILTLALELHGDLDALTELLMNSTKENDSIKVVLNTTSTQVTQLQDLVNIQTAALNDSNNKLNKAITQGALDKKHAHTYKFVLIALAMAGVGLLVFSIFGAVSFTPPLIYVLAGAPLALGTFLYFWMGSG